jgi:hypothetical protein
MDTVLTFPRSVFREDHEMLRETIRRFLERECKPRQAQWDQEGRVDRETWLKAGREGLLCTTLDPEWGGAGGDFGHAAVIVEEIARSGVSFSAINSALSTSLGSAYVNDFPNAGRLQRVVVQADANTRMQPEDLLTINALNAQGQPVPLSAFATTQWITGAMQTVRYNGYPTMRIAGEPAAGQSTGAAIAEMERLASQLPPGFAFE